METLTTNKVVTREVRGLENYECDYEALARNAVKEIVMNKKVFIGYFSFDCSGFKSICRHCYGS